MVHSYRPQNKKKEGRTRTRHSPTASAVAGAASPTSGSTVVTSADFGMARSSDEGASAAAAATASSTTGSSAAGSSVTFSSTFSLATVSTCAGAASAAGTRTTHRGTAKSQRATLHTPSQGIKRAMSSFTQQATRATAVAGTIACQLSMLIMSLRAMRL